MFDVLKTLSALVKNKPVETKPHAKPIVTEVKKPEVVQNIAADSGLNDRIQEQKAQLKILEAKAREMIVEAKDEALKIRHQAEEESYRKMEALDRKMGALEEREKRLNITENDLQNKINKIEQIKNDHLHKLENIARLTHDQAKDQVLSEIKERLNEEMAKYIKEAEAQAHEQAEAKAREIILDSMRHGATDYVAEYTVSVVKIADEEVKGRIIGKEGRNIRAFETATGVDVDLDEEGVIRLSCFDPVRREIARVSLERLLKDGRVQPGRIEEIITQVKKEIERIMFEEGQKLCHAVGVYNLPAPLVAMLGRFKYRFSYGQNMIAHTLEETKIGIAIAQETGADVNIVRLGCLLHDIGKVITDKEGNHVQLGVELLKKYQIPLRVVDCVAQHHEDTPFSSSESLIVYIADSISGGRPGARYENYDEYIKRLKDIEAIAKDKKGVTEAFAFQAGRELRVLVKPEEVDDAQTTILAHEIKNEIQNKITYPGQVKVTVVREYRAFDVAT